jgi:hypothetical protein
VEEIVARRRVLANAKQKKRKDVQPRNTPTTRKQFAAKERRERERFNR